MSPVRVSAIVVTTRLPMWPGAGVTWCRVPPLPPLPAAAARPDATPAATAAATDATSLDCFPLQAVNAPASAATAF